MEASPLSSSRSLCFSEASQKFKDQEITQVEYYHNILTHCTSYLHDEDDDDFSPSLSLSLSSSLQSNDPFAYAVQCFMKRKDFIKDITPLEEAFKALDKQDLQTIRRAATKLEDSEKNAKKFFHKILALRALQLRKAQVLRYCLSDVEPGLFPYEAYFEDEADRVREEDDPLTFKVLEESHFRKIYPRKDVKQVKPKDNKYEDDDLKERDRAAAAFDEGGEFPVDW